MDAENQATPIKPKSTDRKAYNKWYRETHVDKAADNERKKKFYRENRESILETKRLQRALKKTTI
jgi:hypothetical protein